MEENRFYRFVWRVNGVAIMLLLVLAIGAGGYSIIREILQIGKHQPIITNVAADPKGEEKWKLGSPQGIDGTAFIYMPLESENKSVDVLIPNLGSMVAKRAYGGYFSPSRNILFINSQTRDMKWLFNDNKQLIANMQMLSVQKRNEENREIDAILYQVISKDTNGDKKLTAEDIANIAISNPDGSGYKEVIQSVDQLMGSMSIKGREVLVLYQSKGKGYAATISLQDMTVRDTKEMPRVEQ